MSSTKQTKITGYVRVYRKRPGPPKKKSQSGAAAARGSNSSGASASASAGNGRKISPAKPHGERGKVKTDWSKGDALARLTSAVEDWDALVASGKPHMKRPAFAKSRGIAADTFGRYACGEKGDPKRRKLGAASGRQALLNDDEQQLLVDSIRRRDRGNEGVSTDGAIDMVRTIKPDLTHKQAESQVHGSLRRKHSAVLTKTMVVPQPTTTKRSATTPDQQYRWHVLIDTHALDFMRTENTGVCRMTGRCRRRSPRRARPLRPAGQFSLPWRPPRVRTATAGSTRPSSPRTRTRTRARTRQLPAGTPT